MVFGGLVTRFAIKYILLYIYIHTFFLVSSLVVTVVCKGDLSHLFFKKIDKKSKSIDLFFVTRWILSCVQST